MENFNDSKALAIEIAKILDKKKAHDVRVLKVESLTVLTDYFVIASGTSTTRTPAGSSVSGPRNSSSAISVVRIFPHSRLSGACRPLFFVHSMGKLKLFQTKIKKTLALVRQIWYHKVRCYR